MISKDKQTFVVYYLHYDYPYVVLIELMRGNREMSAGEKLLASVASTIEPDDVRGDKKVNWPVAIFAGAVFAVPIVSYKLLGLMGPIANGTHDISFFSTYSKKKVQTINCIDCLQKVQMKV